MPKYTGQCQCGHVRYHVAGEAITVFACHCPECQRQSSSAFGMVLWIRDAEVELLSGSTKTWQRTTKTGAEMNCRFCPECGTRLFHSGHAGSGVVSIKPGTLDDTSWLRPSGHIWTQRAQSWLTFEESAHVFEADPPSFDLLIEAWEPPHAR